MKNLIPLLICTACAAQPGARMVVPGLARPDTIIRSPLRAETPFERRAGCTFGEEVWLAFPAEISSDSIYFYRFNTRTLLADTVSGYVPGLKSQPYVSSFYSISVNDSFLVGLVYGWMVIFERDGKRLTYKNLVPEDDGYNYCRLQGEEIVLGIYNKRRAGYETLLSRYHIPSGKYTAQLRPHISTLEFCHFSPNQWIDASDNYVLVSQTTEYRIDIYRKNFEHAASLRREVPGWRQFDTTILDKYYQDKDKDRKHIIFFMSDYNDSVSRIESANFVNDSTIIVRHKPPYNSKEGYYRLFDVWKLRSGVWTLAASDYADEQKSEGKATQENLAMAGYQSTLFYAGDKLIVLKRGTEKELTGKSFRKYYQNQREAVYQGKAYYNLHIYRISPLI